MPGHNGPLGLLCNLLMNCSGGERALLLHKPCKAGVSFVSPSRLQNGLPDEGGVCGVM